MNLKKNNSRPTFLLASFVGVMVVCALTPAMVSALARLNTSEATRYSQYTDGTRNLLAHDYVNEELQAEWKAKKEEEARIAEEEAQRQAEEAARQASYESYDDGYNESYDESYDSGYNDGYSYSGGSGVLTREGGVNYYNGNMETWYSQNVLPGGGLNIPGRHVAEDGTVRDGDGNIVVASDNYAYGTQVETSLGPGKVYDTGVGHDGWDIYTAW